MLDLVFAGIVAAIVSWTVAARRCERWKRRAEVFNQLAHGAHASTERWMALAQTWKSTAETWKSTADTERDAARRWRETAEMRGIVPPDTSGLRNDVTSGGGTTEEP